MKFQFVFLLLLCVGLFTMSLAHADVKKATFAGGCFWCIQAAYDEQPGVIQALSGYMGGEKENPSYSEIKSGTSGYREVVEVAYDPQKTTYETLLDIFWKNIDPTQKDGQFGDKGPEYQTAIFYHDNEQNLKAEKSKMNLEDSKKFSRPIVVEILPAKKFYPAEEVHQGFHKKNWLHYELYKVGSGRAGFIEKNWGKK